MQMASCNGGPDQSKPHLRAEVNMGICSGFLGQVSGSRNGNRNLRLRVPANCNSRGSSAYVGGESHTQFCDKTSWVWISFRGTHINGNRPACSSKRSEVGQEFKV